MRLRLFDAGRREGTAEVVHDSVLTAANAITVVRLAGLPLFVWLVVGPRAYGKAFAVLVAVAVTDWVDGYVARRFDQVSRLGRVLDPLVDRVLLATATITLFLAGFLPGVVLAAVVGRDLLLLGGALLLFGGLPPIPVSRTGKFATASLLIAVPAFLLAGMQWPGAEASVVVAIVTAALGLVAYWLAGLQYAKSALKLR